MATPNLRFAVLISNVGQVIKRHVTVRLTIAQSPTPIVETRTIERITPWQLNPATVIFGNLGLLQLHRKTTVTIEIEDPGTSPVRYPVIFTRGEERANRSPIQGMKESIHFAGSSESGLTNRERLPSARPSAWDALVVCFTNRQPSGGTRRVHQLEHARTGAGTPDTARRPDFQKKRDRE